MNKKDINFIVGLIFFLTMIFCFKGWEIGFKAMNNLNISLRYALNWLNLIALHFYEDTLLTLIFTSSITFLIVGIILELFNITKGKFGETFGNLFFWLIGFPVSLILNIIGNLFFH